MNVFTIGDLCALSEYDIHLLPMRSPKVETARKVLEEYHSKLKKIEELNSDMGKSLTVFAVTQMARVRSFSSPTAYTVHIFIASKICFIDPNAYR